MRVTPSSRRIALAAAALILSGAAAVTTTAVSSAASGDFEVGVPTVVDPVRGAGEPLITVDNHGGPWISGPAGTSTQTSWFWRSRDEGQTYQLFGPPGGHWVCAHSGGGDSLLAYDRLSDQMYLTDQEALASLATGRYDVSSGQMSSSCLSTPAMTADRNFEAILHPAGPSLAPQWVEGGHKPIIYMSWLCQGCLGGPTGGGGGGLAYAWSDDGVNWHAADVGVPFDQQPFNQLYESSSITSFQWHGTMAVDQQTGYVYTGLSCGSSCPNGSSDPEVGIAIGKPGTPAERADAGNIGQFASMSYQTAANKIDGQAIRKTGSLFPIIAMDSGRTLYLAWIVGDGGGDDPDSTPDSQEWHLYYTYSTDAPNYKTGHRRVASTAASTRRRTCSVGWLLVTPASSASSGSAPTRASSRATRTTTRSGSRSWRSPRTPTHRTRRSSRRASGVPR